MKVNFFSEPYLLYKGDLPKKLFTNILISEKFMTLSWDEIERRRDIIMICKSEVHIL